MGTIYCEFCGAAANDKARTPERLIDWIHHSSRDVVRCQKHQRTSKMVNSHRSHDALTGRRIKRELTMQGWIETLE